MRWNNITYFLSCEWYCCKAEFGLLTQSCSLSIGYLIQRDGVVTRWPMPWSKEELLNECHVSDEAVLEQSSSVALEWERKGHVSLK